MKNILILCCLPVLLFAQERDSSQINTLYDTLFDQYYYNDYDSSLLLLNKIEDLTRQDKWWDEALYAIIKKGDLSTYHNDFVRTGESITEGDQLIQQYESKILEKHRLRFNVNKGLYYSRLGFFQRSADVFDENISTLEQKELSNDYQKNLLSNAYRGKARALTKLGAVESAVKLFQKSEVIENERAQNGDKSKLGLVYRFLADVFVKKEDFINAERYYQLAIKISESDYKKATKREGQPLNRLIYSYSNFAQFLQLAGKQKQALKFVNKAILLSKEKSTPDTESIQLLGDFQLENKDYQEAIASYGKSLKIRTAAFGISNFKATQTKISLAKAYSLQGKHSIAIERVMAGVNDFTDEFQSKDKLENPPLALVNNKKEYLNALKAKSAILYRSFQASADPSDLEAAMLSTQLATELIDIIRLDYSSDLDKMYLAKTSLPIYEQGIILEEIAFRQTNNPLHIERAFAYAEKSKSLSLLEAFTSVDDFARLPKGKLEEEKQLKVALTKLQTKIEKAKQKGNNKAIEKLQPRLLRQEDLYADFLFKLEQEYPEYFKIKRDLKAISIATIQEELLQKDQAFLEYVLGEKHVYLFYISRSQYLLKRIPNSPKVIQEINAFRKSITQNQAQKKVVELAHSLYQQLIEPVQEAINKEEIQYLSIVPDKQLGYLPFDILLTEKAQNHNFKKLPYLLRKQALSYGYSATLLSEQIQKEPRSNAKSFAAFAPSYKDYSTKKDEALATLVREGLYELKGAEQEAKELQELLGGDLFLNDAANEEGFKKNAADYKILHLAMHSLVNDKNPLFSKLLFTANAKNSLEDQELNAIELYGMPLNADLAVLSACNTGFGKIQQGEGIMSLSRAFTYAGVPSTVMSLWKVPDEATSSIMVDFYEELKEGQELHRALQTAKLQYLDQIEEPELAHPYYWAGFLPAGKMNALTFSARGYSRYKWFGIGIFSFLVLVFLGKRKS